MQDLRANTQVIVRVGSFVDATDGVTPETGITLGAADQAELIKHGSTTVVDIAAATWAAVTGMDGWYALTLTTSHTDTEGQLEVVVQDASVCLPVVVRFKVLSEAAYDSLYVAKDDGFMDVNIKTIGRADTTETEATNLEAACAAYSATRGLAGTALPAAAANAANGLPISIAGGLDLDTKLANTNEVTAARMGALTDWIDGGRLDSILDIIAADTTTDIPALIATLQEFVDTEVAAIKAKTDNLPSDPADQSAVEAAITAATSPLATAANLATVAGYLDTEIAAILADTNELQTNQGNWLTATGFSTHSAADVLSALGTGSWATSLATQASVDDLPTNAELATALDAADDAVLAAIAALQNLSSSEAFTAVLTTQLTESYAADGAAPTLAQAIFLIQQALTEFAISGTTTTIKKLDGSTTAATLTLDDGTTPTSVTRAT